MNTTQDELEAALVRNRQLQVRILQQLEQLEEFAQGAPTNSTTTATNGLMRNSDLTPECVQFAASSSAATIDRRSALARLHIPPSFPSRSPPFSGVERAALKASVVRRLREALIRIYMERYQHAQAQVQVQVTADSTSDASGSEAMQDLEQQISAVYAMSLPQLEEHLPLVPWEQVARDISSASGTEASGQLFGRTETATPTVTGTLKAASTSVVTAMATMSNGDAPARTAQQCRLEWIAHGSSLVQRGAWSAEEDAKLRAAAQRTGYTRWGQIARELETGRTALQCFRHYRRRLQPRPKKMKWCAHEDGALRDAVAAVSDTTLRASANLIPAPVARINSNASAGARAGTSAGTGTGAGATSSGAGSGAGAGTSAGTDAGAGATSAGAGAGAGAGAISNTSTHCAAGTHDGLLSSSSRGGMWPHVVTQMHLNKVCASLSAPMALAIAWNEHTTQQCSTRWLQTLDPRIVRGRWTVQQDRALRLAVQAFGSVIETDSYANEDADVELDMGLEYSDTDAEAGKSCSIAWVRVAELVPGKTMWQCRERWMNVLNPKLCHSKWTEQEDALLRAAVDRVGEGHWAKIAVPLGAALTAAGLRPRTDNQCFKRWQILQRRSSSNYASASGAATAAAVGTAADADAAAPPGLNNAGSRSQSQSQGLTRRSLSRRRVRAAAPKHTTPTAHATTASQSRPRRRVHGA